MDWRWTYKPPPEDAVLWRNVIPIRDMPGLDWLVPDSAGNRLVYFSNAGLPQWEYQVRLGFDFSPSGVCQISNHALWVTDWRTGRIECRSVFGHQLGRAPALPYGACRSPTDICVTREGHLLVTDMGSSRLYRLDSEGRHLNTLELGQHQHLRPTYVDCCLDTGLIVVSDAENSQAAILTPDGRLQAFLWAARASELPEQPLGVRFEPGGRRRLLLCDAGSHRVARFNLDGAFLDAQIFAGQLKPQPEEGVNWRPRALACGGPSGKEICVVSSRDQGRDCLHCFGAELPGM